LPRAAVTADAPSTSLFGDLQWLSAFHSDGSRLAAIALVCVTLIAIFCLPTIAAVWRADRSDKRANELRKLALTAEIDRQIEQRRKERLNLDA